jgi:flagellar motor protein MotB
MVLLYHLGMRLPWLLALLLVVICATLLVRIGEQRRHERAALARARDEAAEFRQAYFKDQATLAEVDRERASTAATLQQLAAHVSKQAAQDLDQQKLMDELQKRIEAKEGDVSARNGIVTVHLADEILFASGEAELSKHGREVLARLGDVLKPLADKQILVGGHTDDAPIHTARFPSNWELSTARAVNVVHFLVDQVGVDPRKLTAAGYSQYQPRSTDRAQNRRIEILLIPQVASATTPEDAAKQPAASQAAAPQPAAPQPAAPQPAAPQAAAKPAATQAAKPAHK